MRTTIDNAIPVPLKRILAYGIIAGALILVPGAASVGTAAGPRKEASSNCARYSLPADVLAKPVRFAGEAIPLKRRDVRSRIRYQLNFLMLDARSVLTAWLIERSRYAWIFEEVFAAEGIPREFVLLAPVLSSLSTRSSPRLAGVGWWAIEKPCASAEGLSMSRDSWHDDRLDLDLSTRCFAARLKGIRKRLGTKSWITAAAAYVSSEKKVKDAGKNWKTYMYWDLPLPENAEELIVRWIALGIIDSNRKAFGLNLDGSAPLTYDQVTGLALAKDLPIAEISRITGAPSRRILQLNPKIRASRGLFPAKVHGRRVAHTLAAPKGKGVELVNKLKQKGYLLRKP